MYLSPFPFLRLQIEGTWAVISDPCLWRLDLKFRKVSEAADNQDYSQDGDKNDVLWIDNGSDKAKDNAVW